MSDRIEKKIFLRAPRSRVWRALSDATEFGTWFGVKFEGSFSPGAHMTGFISPTQVKKEVGEAQKAHEGKRFEITIERMDPERLFSFRWHPHAIDPHYDYSQEPTTLIEFKIEDAPEGVLLTVTESGFDKLPPERRAEAFSGNEMGWSIMVTSIEAYVAQPA